ncbi:MULTISPECIES: sigma-70 family RNA polymerase sigma factor [unclassified Methylobacterium]|uniref:sigma-70 family RNA polymerase sigma factor n=1 Tax=unclassified Methylobacterium TaxID=2615210 RepID=UPI0006F285E5|nr:MULTISPECIES: sigma-70 family RNA polymerase sigma factor [unclassified Methylobacterium]KQP75127.1 RNA polymerase subunit sigma [Methylobacterium sp. Leaf113]MCK2054900.1 sigma-70 family RNA polymerase sigma factor [Methylobacterium sp. 37f]
MTDMMRLIEPLIPALRRYARALLRNPADADDLVQDCLEHAVGRWHQRRADGDARTWLFAIVHNLAVTQMRRRARRGAHLPIEDTAEANLAVAPTQESGLRHRDLMSALDALPEEQRSVLLLVTVEGLSYAETADILAIPTGTVMSRLSRARDRMIQLMDGADATVPAKRPLLRRVK